ncbi:MAG: DUF1015 domain-containing protein [Lentisphaeria bacterium]|nr:DUF1015 domain-containing protein [Lentisphaeria bacterium]
MATLRPFPAVMPPGTKANLVAQPPYDVVNRQEAAALAAGNAIGFMRVARAEIELPESVDAYDDCVYEKALENYQRLCREVPLTADAPPSFYVYSLVMNGHRQTGVAAAASVDDYDAEIIKKHEKTRQTKEDDRTRHIMTLRSQTGPVFLTYRDSAAIDEIVARTMGATPLFDFVADDGVGHTGWRVAAADTDALGQAFTDIPSLYIADGHHRAASASRARASLKKANPNHTGEEEYNGFLTVTFPASQLHILPYNRVVFDLNGLTPQSLLDAAGKAFDVSKADSASPDSPGTVHLYVEKEWWRLSYKGDASALSPVDRLDVSLLQDLLLAPILGIDDPRTSKRIDFVGGIRGTAELEARVDSGEAKVALSMYPTTIEQLMDIADDNDIMPPKSTWFEPKLRDGLFCHDI